MTAEMAAQMEGEHVARELADTCLAEFDRWAPHAVTGNALVSDKPSAEAALAHLRGDLHDYLCHALATHLTALRLQGALDAGGAA